MHHVVDLNASNHDDTNSIDEKIDFETTESGACGRGFRSLKQTIAD
jgi:hypothetical protein